MIFRPLHPWLSSLAALGVATGAGAAVCGDPSAPTVISAVGPHEMALTPGGPARFAGLQLVPEAQAALAALVGQNVRYSTLAPRADRWGRLLVDLADVNGQSVALDLLARGLARVTPEFETRGCARERLEAEDGARAAGEGLWAKPGAALGADDRDALSAADGRFALVEGRVRRVGYGRTKVYLDFAGRGGFAVVTARKLEPAFRRSGVDLAALAGRRVRVRGVLDVRFGPRIEIADPSMIEMLEGEKETGRRG